MFDTDSQPTLLIIGRGYGQSADNDIPTGVSALESANSEIESADSADSAKVGVWVWALDFV